LDAVLAAASAGRPRGRPLQLGVVRVAASGPAAPPPPASTAAPPPPTTTAARPSARPTAPKAKKHPATSPAPKRKRPKARQEKKPGTSHMLPPNVHPNLGKGLYAFPVYGPAGYSDTYGAARPDVAYHHGDDIFAPLGAPVLAVADGTV